MKPEDLDAWRRGIRLEDGMTLPAEAKLLRVEGDKTWIELTIREGRNQQIRRMGEATRFPVMRLARVAFAGISTEGLAPGRWRHLTRDELVDLKKTYGVPKSIPAAPTAPATAAKGVGAARMPAARRGTAARTQRALGRPAQPSAPRFGGGSPGRRSYAVVDDWGGGAGRGGARDERAREESSERPRDHVGGGRSGRTRTTGTAGGIGAREPAPRVKGRRG
jgi:23S rRNA pseudouridine2605 synthase